MKRHPVIALGLALATPACSAAPSAGPASIPPPTATVQPAPEPRAAECREASALRARLPALAAEGWLDRLARTAARADALCAEESTPEARLALAQALVALRRTEAARIALARIEAAPDLARIQRDLLSAEAELSAPTDDAASRARFGAARRAEAAGDAETARAAYLDAWRARRPDPDALAGAARAADNLGRPAEARPLWARALDEAAAGAASPRIAVPDGAAPIDIVNPPALTASVDRRWIAVTGHTGTVLYEAPSWEPRLVLEPALHLAVDPGGARAALASPGGEIRIYDLPRGTLARSFRPPEQVQLLRFSPDGALLASAGSGEVDVWDAPTGAARARFPASAEDFVFSSQSPVRLVIADATRAAEQPGGRPFSEVPAGGPLMHPRLSPGGREVLWDRILDAPLTLDARGRRRRTLSRRAGPLAWSPDGSTAVLSDGALLDVGRFAVRTQLDLGTGVALESAVFSGPQQVVALTARNRESTGVLGLWDVATGHFQRALEEPVTAPVQAFRVSAGALRMWRYETSPRRRTLVVRADAPGTPSTIELDAAYDHLLPDPRGQRLAATAGADLVILDAGDGRRLGTLSLPGRPLKSPRLLAFSPDGQRLATAAGNALQVWDVERRALLRELSPAGGFAPAAAAVSEDGLVATVEKQGALRVWDAGDGALLFRGALLDCEFSGCRKHLAAFGRQGTLAIAIDSNVEVWDVAEGARRWSVTIPGGIESVEALAVSPSGRLVAATVVGVHETAVRLWDTAGGGARRVVVPFDEPAIARSSEIAFAAGDRVLLVMCDHGVALLDQPSGTWLGTLRPTRDGGSFFVGPSSGSTTAGSFEIFGTLPPTATPRCLAGPHVLPFAACQERLLHPGLLAALLTGAPAPLD